MKLRVGGGNATGRSPAVAREVGAREFDKHVVRAKNRGGPLPMALAAGRRLGPCEVVSSLGAGGMGEVYRARDTRLGRDVAVKVLPDELTHEDRLRRFEKEARLAGSLNHANVVALYDVGSEDGVPYLVTELLEGRTLRELLLHGPLSVRRSVECGQQIARGLAAAHAKGIVHRDLKPANLFVTREGRSRSSTLAWPSSRRRRRGISRARSIRRRRPSGSAFARPCEPRARQAFATWYVSEATCSSSRSGAEATAVAQVTGAAS